MLSSLILHKNNETFLNQTVMLNEKWILYENQWLHGWTEKKFQNTSHSQTCTNKRSQRRKGVGVGEWGQEVLRGRAYGVVGVEYGVGGGWGLRLRPERWKTEYMDELWCGLCFSFIMHLRGSFRLEAYVLLSYEIFMHWFFGNFFPFIFAFSFW